jgi:carbonic anhydrase
VAGSAAALVGLLVERQRSEPDPICKLTMDPRLSDLPAILGLPHADIDVIRTGGPGVTEDVLGELVVSTRVLGTTEIMLLNHTGCGFTTFTDEELNAKLRPNRRLVARSDALLLL